MGIGEPAGPFRSFMLDKTSRAGGVRHRLADSDKRGESHGPHRIGHISHVIFLPAAIQEQLRMAMVLSEGYIKGLLVDEKIPPQHPWPYGHEQTEEIGRAHV